MGSLRLPCGLLASDAKPELTVAEAFSLPPPPRILSVKLDPTPEGSDNALCTLICTALCGEQVGCAVVPATSAFRDVLGTVAESCGIQPEEARFVTLTGTVLTGSALDLT